MNRNVLYNALKLLRSTIVGDELEDRLVYIGFENNSLNLIMQTNFSDARFKIPVEFDFEGSCFIDIDFFTKTIGASSNTSVLLRLEDDDILTVKSGRSRIRIKTLEHALRDSVHEFENPINLNPRSIKQALSPVGAYAEPNSKIENIQGVFVNDGLTFVGTQQKIACYKRNPFNEDFFIYYPLIKFIEGLDGEVTISYSKDYIKIESDGLRFISLINREMQVPQVKKLIERPVMASTELRTEELKEVAKSCGIIKPEKIRLTAGGYSGEGNLLIEFFDSRSDFTMNINELDFEESFDVVIDTAIFVKAVNMLGEEVKLVVFSGDLPSVMMESGDFIQLLSAEYADEE
jgi:DNA polymerase III sliding clamp (beta) subunit (PCNA family)